GFGDDGVDPLIAADKGDKAPAFRDCAYVVFEDLQLVDFGNRIPALTFEISAEGDETVSLKELIPQASETSESALLNHTKGFADEGGPLSGTLSAIDRVFPISCTTTRSGLRLSSAIEVPAQVLELPEQLSSESSEDAQERHKTRAHSLGQEPLALRYYDEDRDYQPGVQRAIGLRPNGRELMIDLPATMTAQGAKALANDNSHRAKWRHETIVWRIGELNPAINPGSVVRLPETQGLWRVRSWEWYDRGIELGLERLAPGAASTLGSDPGEAQPPSDVALAPTHLQVFEVPPEDTNNPSSTIILAAASSESSAWNGAALYSEQGETLVPIGSTGSLRAISGELSAPLPASSSFLFEPAADLYVEVHADDLAFLESDIAGIAAGANRLLVGNEIIQFRNAQPLGERQWRLSGLLRGRAGTEHYAQAGHAAATPFALLDNRLTDLTNAGLTSDPGLRIAAIGRGDAEAVYALLQNPGLSRRPLVPVHPRVIRSSDAALEICWTRRARGQWRWDAQGEAPLIEEAEEYLVGYGPTSAPYAAFSTSAPSLTLSLAEQTTLLTAHGPADLWVRQVGTYASSDPLWLTQLS
ncbi:MAG: phage tail protein, partial [Pseudomonadota bacterium]